VVRVGREAPLDDGYHMGTQVRPDLSQPDTLSVRSNDGAVFPRLTTNLRGV
jgi:hypothetical protein